MPELDRRAEGVYLKTEMFPSADDPDARKLFIIERVAGNGSVERITLTTEEAQDLRDQLNPLLFEEGIE